MSGTRKTSREIFEQAWSIGNPDERRVFVADACGPDTDLRVELEELLGAHDTAGGFLGDPARTSATTTAAQAAEQIGDLVGRYRLLRKIGEGGCGEVYEAEQAEPVRRRVALKVIKLGMDTRSVIARFEAERQALALMDHPGVARVFDAGAGRPYFVMELVQGLRITDYCDQERLPVRDRVRLLAQVCQAIQHAHQKGVIHRDIKPSNVLVAVSDGVPVPKVIDFGIAKAAAGQPLTDKTLFTQFELFLGTPAYMSPEQAEFNTQDVDTRTDIYSLGVLLYELLTGQVPFDTRTLLGSGLDTMRRTIRETVPARPSTRLALAVAAASTGRPASSGNPGPTTEKAVPTGPLRPPRPKGMIAELRGDLDWIVLKALEKDRTRRYATANALAADLQRHLDHEPVVARPPSALYLFGRTVRRHRPAFAVAAAVALLLVASAVFIVRDAARTRTAAKVQQVLREQAEQANQRLSRNLFGREWQDAEQLLAQDKIASGLAWFARAARDHPDDRAIQTRLLSILSENNFALPAAAPFVHDTPLVDASLSADENHLITAAEDGWVRIWPLGAPGEPRTLPQRFSRPTVAAVSPGNRVLVADLDSLSLWDLNGTLVQTVPSRHALTSSQATTADRRHVLLNAGDGSPQLWDATDLRPVGERVPDALPWKSGAVLSPDGRYLFGLDKKYEWSAWDASSGRRVRHLKGLTDRFAGLLAMAFHPDGSQVALCRDVPGGGKELQVWDLPPENEAEGMAPSPAAPVFALPARTQIRRLCFSPTGDRLFTGDDGGQIGWVNVTTHEFKTLRTEDRGQILRLAVSADGSRLATASIDGTAWLWDVRMNSPEPRIVTNGAYAYDAEFSPDSHWFVSASTDNVGIREVATAALRHRLPIAGIILRVDVSPDGRRMVAYSSTGEARVWDTQSGLPVSEAVSTRPGVYTEFSHDGRWFLIVPEGHTVEVHETETGRQVGPTLTNSAQLVSAHFSPDGRWLAAAMVNGDLNFRSLPEGLLRESSARHKDVIWTARFSPDGRRLVTASRDRTAALWDVESGARLREFHHDQEVYSAAFSPDGRRILTGEVSGRARVWDAESGTLLFSLMAHADGVWYGEFSADGRVLLTGDIHRVRLWAAESGLPLSGWIGPTRLLRRTHLSPDGRYGLTADDDGSVRVWPVLLAPLPAPPWLADLAEAVAGHRLRADGLPEPVPPERWQALSATLAALPGEDFYARWARWFFVERRQPRVAEFVP